MCLENDKYGLGFEQPISKAFTLWHLGLGIYTLVLSVTFNGLND